MQFDFKITTWERVTVDQEDEQKVLEAIKDGSVTSANDIFNLCDNADYNILAETEEQMTVEENGGSSTIEVIDADGNTIFSNGKS
jgi:hypothetical protein